MQDMEATGFQTRQLLDFDREEVNNHSVRLASAYPSCHDNQTIKSKVIIKKKKKKNPAFFFSQKQTNERGIQTSKQGLAKTFLPTGLSTV